LSVKLLFVVFVKAKSVTLGWGLIPSDFLEASKPNSHPPYRLVSELEAGSLLAFGPLEGATEFMFDLVAMRGRAA
jgi:hypothetical protein